MIKYVCSICGKTYREVASDGAEIPAGLEVSHGVCEAPACREKYLAGYNLDLPERLRVTA